jgi:hypothetical protein
MRWLGAAGVSDSSSGRVWMANEESISTDIFSSNVASVGSKKKKMI